MIGTFITSRILSRTHLTTDDVMNNSEKESLSKKWLGKLVRLNPATGRGHCSGKAPHKPLLLLCLLDMAEDGEITQRTFTRTPDLVLRFKSYGGLVTDRWPTRLDLSMPFFYLKSQGFWCAFTPRMEPALSPESCMLCEMHEELFALLADADFRLKARVLLISHYFTKPEQLALMTSMGLRDDARSPLPNVEKLSREAADAARQKGRSTRFAVQVVSSYKFTCALTGLCCVTSDGSAIVDAAHIEPWSQSRNDDPSNGLALSKNAHWMFDEGLWSIARDGRVVTAQRRFTECGPDQLRLASYAGRLLQFADGVALRPEGKFLATHRRMHGFD